MSDNRIVSEQEVDRRTILGVEVRVELAVWSNGGRSYSVYRVDDGTDLTADESFDDMPTSSQIAELFDFLAGDPIRLTAEASRVGLPTADDVVIVVMPRSERGHPRRVILAADGRYAVQYRTADGYWLTSSDLELRRVGVTHE